MFGNDVSFNQLRHFVVLAEELHFRRAAHRLNLTQPPLSRSIRSLEYALGVELFHRTTRRVSLTPAGDKFLGEARRVLNAMQKARERTQIVASSKTGVVVLGFIEPVAREFLPRLLAAVRKESPHLRLEFVQMGTVDQVQALHNGEIDAGIARPFEDLAGLECHTIYRDELILALPDSHRFANFEKVNLKLLSDPFIVYSAERGQSLYNALREACAAVGSVPRIAYEASSTTLMMSLVAAGEGIALVSKELTGAQRPGIRFVRVSPNSPYLRINMMWRADAMTPALASVIRHAKNTASQI